MKKIPLIFFISALCLIINKPSFSQNVNVSPNATTYATLNAAFTAINSGSHGSGVVTVLIIGNTTEIATAALNGGVFTSCLITPSGARTITANFNSSIISLNGADNVTIDGLDSSGNSLTIINSNSGTFANGIQCENGATNNTIRNVTAVGSGASGSTAGGRGFNIGPSSSGTGGNNDNTIEYCISNGFRRGIQTFGSAGLFVNERTVIRNCIAKNFTSLGIFLGSETRDNTVELCELFYDTLVANDVAGVRAISIQSCGLNSIRKNKIHDLSGTVAGGFSGIVSIPSVFASPNITPITKIEISNNFIALNNCISSSQFIYGILTASNTVTINHTINVYFNSVRITGSSASTADVLTLGFQEVLDGMHGPDTVRVYNNLFINERLDGDVNSDHIGIDLRSVNGVSLESDYNTVFAKDTTGRGWAARFNGTLFSNSDSGNSLYHDSTIYKNIEQLTAFDNVHFVSNTDLHLAGKVSGNMNAKNISSINNDIDGDSRAINSTNLFTYRGADEHLPAGGAWRKVTMDIVTSYQGYNTFNPSGNIKYSLKYIIASDGKSQLCVPVRDSSSANHTYSKIYAGDSIASISYWLVDAGYNTLETWSGNLVSFSSTANAYNFTTSLSQAYGSNMFGSSPPYQIYTGDVNQDDVIDATDAAAVDNDAYNFVTGFRIKTDVNFDEIVEASDAAIVDNNAFNFVAKIVP